MLLTDLMDDKQVWATKLGDMDEEGVPSFVEVELWRTQNDYAPDGERDAKKMKTIRYVPIVMLTDRERLVDVGFPKKYIDIMISKKIEKFTKMYLEADSIKREAMKNECEFFWLNRKITESENENKNI